MGLVVLGRRNFESCSAIEVVKIFQEYRLQDLLNLRLEREYWLSSMVCRAIQLSPPAAKG